MKNDHWHPHDRMDRMKLEPSRRGREKGDEDGGDREEDEGSEEEGRKDEGRGREIFKD